MIVKRYVKSWHPRTNSSKYSDHVLKVASTVLSTFFQSQCKVLHNVAKNRRFDGSNLLGNPFLQVWYVSRFSRIHLVLKKAPEEEVWGTEFG